MGVDFPAGLSLVFIVRFPVWMTWHHALISRFLTLFSFPYSPRLSSPHHT
jgi:hypothetical protein